jgi:hypothetical protein
VKNAPLTTPQLAFGAVEYPLGLLYRFFVGFVKQDTGRFADVAASIKKVKSVLVHDTYSPDGIGGESAGASLSHRWLPQSGR